MKGKTILIFLMIIFASINMASAYDMWISDSSVISGLTEVGYTSKPTVFLDGSTLKLISGKNDGNFLGWHWDGSTWISDSSVISGLSDIGDASSPMVFLDGSTLKLIAGAYNGNFYGYYWDGSTWISDSSIVSGLSDVGDWSIPMVFLDSSTLKLIAGAYNGNFYGYYWDGSTWISDSSVVSGLPDVGFRSSPMVFLDSSTLKLIAGANTGSFLGWYWSGSTWVSDDSSIVSGLSDVGSVSSPMVFLDSSTLKLISGELQGDFYGWSELIPYNLSGTITNENGAVNNATINLSGAGGSTTSNEIGYYEITGITPGTYTISVTKELHYDYSDAVSITSDTEKNIFLTVIPLEIVSIVAPPPLIPTEIPTPLLIKDTELTIIEESIEKLNELSILIINLMGKGLTWSFLLASYIGALVSSVLIKGKKEDEESDLLNILLFGTIGWVLLLLINTLPYITILTANFILNSFIFGIAGFVVYTILDMVTTNE